MRTILYNLCNEWYHQPPVNALPVILVVLAAGVGVWALWPAGPARVFRALLRRRGRLHSREIRVAGIRWHYLEGGHGEPLVLLHGFNGDADHFCRVSEHLSNHFRVLVPDLPGFGESGAGPGVDFRIENRAAAVFEWLDALGVKSCYLGGNSMGGYIACAMARARPERTRALWLLAPGGVHDVDPSPVFQEILEDRHNPLVVRNRADFLRLMDYCFVHPPWIPGVLVRYLARRSADHAVMHQRAFDAIRFDSAPLEVLVAGMNTPALVVWGRSDQVLNPAGAAVLEKAMAAAEVLMIPDTGHLPMLERPCTVAESWLSYTERLVREGPTG